MKPLPKDARQFVDSVVDYINTDGKSKTAGLAVRKMLSKVTAESDSASHARVESAVDLTAEEKNRVQDIVDKISGIKAGVEYAVVPELMAGFRITIGEWIIDASLANQLEEIKKYLIR